MAAEAVYHLTVGSAAVVLQHTKIEEHQLSSVLIGTPRFQRTAVCAFPATPARAARPVRSSKAAS